MEEASRGVVERILQELDYGTHEGFVVDEEGHRVKDRYTGEPVRVDNVAILPGSTIILDDNPLSITSYLEEFES